MWMLRRLDADHAWLEVSGWSIDWGSQPSHCCPLFKDANIMSDFHWSLYSRFTSKEAQTDLKVCALAEVAYDEAFRFYATGRIRLHPNVPPESDSFTSQEALRFRRDQAARRARQIPA